MNGLVRFGRGLRELSLFAGAGGGILGGTLLGWRTVCAVEFADYPRRVLLARQRDGWLPRFPIWDDVRTFDGKPWRGGVDIITGGFPCQDISAAGKGAGIEGERSGLWKEMARIIGEVRPRYVLVENSPMLTSRGLGVVLGDLASLGYDAQWIVLGANDAGAPHKRDRIWILANSRCGRLGEPEEREMELQGRAETVGPGSGYQDSIRPRPEPDNLLAHSSSQGLQSPQQQALLGTRGGEEGGAVAQRSEVLADAGREHGSPWDSTGVGAEAQERTTGAVHNQPSGERRLRHCASSGLQVRLDGQMGQPGQAPEFERPNWWSVEPAIRPLAHGMADGLDQFGTAHGVYLGRVARGVPARADQLKAIGNGQCPAQLVLAVEILGGEL